MSIVMEKEKSFAVSEEIPNYNRNGFVLIISPLATEKLKT